MILHRSTCGQNKGLSLQLIVLRNYHVISKIWMVGLGLLFVSGFILFLSYCLRKCLPVYSKVLENIFAGAAEMPDAMEIIFQEALSVGKSGAVSTSLVLSACPQGPRHKNANRYKSITTRLNRSLLFF